MRRMTFKRFFSRKGGHRPQSRKRFTPLMLFGAILLVATVFFLWLDSSMKPIIKELALTRANYLATKVLNEAVNDEITQIGIEYSDIITLDKDSDNHITALRTNMIEINSLRSKIIALVAEKISVIDTSEISIPLGNLFGIDYLAGRGPRIPIKILPAGSATAKFLSVFSSAGINQTRHQINLELTANIVMLLPGGTVSAEVMTQINVAETLIIGAVPEAYTHIEGLGDQEIGEIIDFQAAN